MMPAAIGELVDHDRLTQFLREILPDVEDVTVDLLSGGSSNLTFLVQCGGSEYVARRRPLGPVPPGAHDMAREYKVQAALAGGEVPVPNVYGFCDDEAVLGAPFYVMSRVHGAVFHEPKDVAGLSPDQASDISEAVIDVLDVLHRVDPVAVGLGDLGRPGAFVARRIGRWLDQWRRSPHRAQPLVEQLAEQLEAAVPDQAVSTLVHGDYRLGNMMIGVGRRPRVAAVLDWELSTLGDPMTDLAHLLVYWEPTRGRITHESQRIGEQAGFWTGRDLADRYGQLSGRSVDRLDFYLAFEHWRAAIIKEGIHAHRAAGHDPAAMDGELGESVGRHLEEAAELLAGR